MRSLISSTNVDNSDLINYPNGRIKNNTGTGNGTPVNEYTQGDLYQMKEKLLRLYGIQANGLPDNETNGFQLIDALRALASKNDFVLPLSLNSGVLSVPIKIGFMLENEQVVCKSNFNLGSQTEIKGLDATTFSFTKYGDFKSGEYVRLIKTSAGVDIVRVADHVSLDSMMQGLLYLKKATQSEENAGAVDTASTTPQTNKVAFTRRVNGLDSASYLATALVNGLYSKEHFVLVERLRKVRNVGFFTGLDVGALSNTLTVGGDVASATVGATSVDSFVTVNLTNAMDNTSYMVKTWIESLGSIDNDNDIYREVFKPISTTQFQLGIRELGTNIQNIKVHIEVIQL